MRRNPFSFHFPLLPFQVTLSFHGQNSEYLYIHISAWNQTSYNHYHPHQLNRKRTGTFPRPFWLYRDCREFLSFCQNQEQLHNLVHICHLPHLTDCNTSHQSTVLFPDNHLRYPDNQNLSTQTSRASRQYKLCRLHHCTYYPPKYSMASLLIQTVYKHLNRQYISLPPWEAAQKALCLLRCHGHNRSQN